MEVLRLVREAEPPPPSSLLAKGGGDRLPQDLEAVCLNCLEKDPARRYPSAAALADDLERFLGDQPVRARTPGTVDRLRKFARRNKALVFAASAIFLALIVGLAFATVGFVDARRQEARAQTIRTFVEEIQHLVGRETPTNVLAVARRFEESPAARDPEVEVAVRRALADVYRSMRFYADAETQLQLALAAGAKLRGEGHLDVALVLGELADLMRAKGDAAAGEGYARRASEIFSRRSAELGLDPPAEMPPALLGLWVRIAQATERLRRPVGGHGAADRPRHPLRAGRPVRFGSEGLPTRSSSRTPAIIGDGSFTPFSALRTVIVRNTTERIRKWLRLDPAAHPWIADARRRPGLPYRGPEMIRPNPWSSPSRTRPPFNSHGSRRQRGWRRYSSAISSPTPPPRWRSRSRDPNLDQPAAQATVDFFLAMTYHELHWPREQAEAMTRGRAGAEALPKAGVDDLGEGVENWILCQLRGTRRRQFRRKRPTHV